MKKLSIVTAFLLHFILLIASNIYAQPGDDGDKNYYPPFSISYPQPYYQPGDTVKIKLSAEWENYPAVFSVKVYTVKDPEQFILMQSLYLNNSVVGRDSSNLSGLLEEYAKFDAALKVVKKTNHNFDSYSIYDDIKFVPNDYGTYLVRIYYKERVSTCGFFVSSLALSTRITENSLLNFTANRITGEPTDSVKLSLFLNGIKYGEGYTSGGALHTQFSEQQSRILGRNYSNNPLFIAIKGKEAAVSDPHYYFYGRKETFTGYIITNQPVYRPPAAVHFKAVLRGFGNEGYTVYAGKNALVTIKDPGNTKIYRKLLKTDEYGSINDSIFINEEAPLGDYYITVTVTDDSLKEGDNNFEIQKFSQVFSVDEYKKPEYKIEVKTDKEQYSNKDTVKINVQSDYYFGSPVQEAEVKYTVHKKPLYKPWWYFSEYRWWYESYYTSINKTKYQNSSFIDEGKGKLDKNGHLEISYSIKENFKEKLNNYYYENDEKAGFYETDYTYIINVYVTDKSRQSIFSTKIFNVTRSDYTISANTAKYIYRPGEKIGLVVRAVDFSDKKVETNVIVSVNRTVFEGKYPNQKKITTFEGTFSGKTSVTGDEVVFIDADREGYYELEIVSHDKAGRKVSDKQSCFVSEGYMWWWNRNPETVEIIPDKESYMPGDTCTALVMTAHENVPFFVTNYNRNIVSYWVERSEGNAVYIKIPIYENCSPNFFINVTYTFNNNTYSGSCRAAVLPVKKLLNVELASDKPVYKPRDTGMVNISIKDLSGKPVPGAEVTIGMIDESIYAIKSESVKDIKTAFYSPVADFTAAGFNFNQPVYYSIPAAFPSIFEMTDYKQVKPEKICKVTGKIKDNFWNNVSGTVVVIDKKYHAATSGSEGTFEFIIPEGSYEVQVFNNNEIYEGSIVLNASGGNSYDLLMKIASSNIVYATIDGIYINPLETFSSENKGKGVCRLSGRVTDAKDELPLPGAIISINGTSLKTSSDDKGEYFFQNVSPGVYNLKCTYVGYEPMIVKDLIINQFDYFKTVNFSLSVGGGLSYDTMIIMAERNPAIMDKSEMRISPKTWNEYGIRGIENIASKQSGIVQDEKGNTINIRGGRTGDNIIIIDGVMTNNPLDDMNKKPEDIKYVEAVTRSDFRDAVLWMPSVRTDENGNAQVKVVFPDNLTTWRITARAITKQTEVGQNTSSIISRKDLIIRVETPRFFQQNDIVTVSTIIHNYLDEDKQTKVYFNPGNAILLSPQSNEQVITMLKNEEKRLDWTVKVDNPIGMSTVFASALTNSESDAMEKKLVTHPFGLKIENHSAFRVTSNGLTQTFSIPQNTDLRSAGLELSVSPSLAASLLSSLDGLIGYPYGCVEQTMSRFMPTVITEKVLKDIGAPSDPYFNEQIPRMVNKGFSKLASMQHKDYGWGWWAHDQSNPFMTAYVVYGLTLAKQNGYEAKDIRLKKAIKYLKNQLENKKIDNSTLAYITWVVTIADSSYDNIIFKSLNRLEEKKNLNDISKAFLSMAAGNIGDKKRQTKYIDELMRNSIKDNDGYYWGGKVFKYYWQEDNIQATAMVLKALMASEEGRVQNKDVIEQGISWMLSKKKGTMWGNTQQTAMAVYAISDYIRLNRETETDYNLKVWVNNSNVLDKQVTAADIFKSDIKIGVRGSLIKHGENNIRIEKTGTGVVYASRQVVYYESENKKVIENTDNGFDVERDYYVLEKKYDKSNEEYYYVKSDYKSAVKSGKEIFVKVKVTPGIDNAEYFMLEEPIPAGCEVIKEDWAYPVKNETYYNVQNSDSWRWWYSDKDIRDNRIVFFVSSLENRRTYEFTYLLRAQIPGTYNVMPSRGVLMYYPEIYGSSSNMVIKIED